MPMSSSGKNHKLVRVVLYEYELAEVINISRCVCCRTRFVDGVSTVTRTANNSAPR